jgi:hypothetical protein
VIGFRFSAFHIINSRKHTAGEFQDEVLSITVRFHFSRESLMRTSKPKSLRQATASKPPSPSHGAFVRVLTVQERLADMRAHGRKVGQTKESALAFLRRAGIVDESGALAEPFRT